MDYNSYESTYGRSYPQEHYGKPPPKSSPTMGDYISAMDFYQSSRPNYFDVDAVTALAANVEALEKQLAQVQIASVAQVTKTCDICGGGHPNHKCQSGNVNLVDGTIENTNFVSNFYRYNDPYNNTYNQGWENHPNFAWNNNYANTQQANQFQMPWNDFEAPVPMYPPEFQDEAQREEEHDDSAHLLSKIEALEQELIQQKAHMKNLERMMAQLIAANLEGQQEALPSNTEENSLEQVTSTTLRSEDEVEGPPRPTELKEKEREPEEESNQQCEIESMVEAIEEGKDGVEIDNFEEFPTENPLETRVEEIKEIGYSNFEIDMFVIPPHVPSQDLELKILIGQVQGKDKWLIQIQIYYLEATKTKEGMLGSTPKFFLSSMKHSKGKKLLMHGWHNFPFDPGGVELWSG